MTTVPDRYPDRSRSPRLNARRGSGPLAGIRVADFCWAGVGAIATRLLADYGAEVIKIEDRQRVDMTRRLPMYKGEPARAFGNEDVNPDLDKSGFFNNYNRNKLSLTVNMRSPKGRALVDELIGRSSVVTENFAPGVMERWGLSYARLCELNPSVIYGRMSGYGHSGPDADYRSYGPVVQAVSGLSFISGLPGMPPSGWGLSYMDNQAAYFNSAALLMAIYQRNRTGLGTEIDVSAVEVGIKLMGPLLLEVGANGRRTSRRSRSATGSSIRRPRRMVFIPHAARIAGSPLAGSTTTNGARSRPSWAILPGRRPRSSPRSRRASHTRMRWTGTSRRGPARWSRTPWCSGCRRPACAPPSCRMPRI